MPDTGGLAIDSESVQSNCETITSNSDGTTLEELLYRSFLIDHIKTYRFEMKYTKTIYLLWKVSTALPL